MTDIAEQIQSLEVPARSIAIWYLGQNGWIVKSPGGTLIAVDPYLSDAISGRRPGLDTARKVPLPLPPDRLKADVFLCTHSHADHADPESIRGARKAGTRQFAGAAEAVAVFERTGIPEEERQVVWPNGVLSAGDITITGTFALPTDQTDLNHMGFVLSIQNGPRFYVTGDSAPSPLLRAAKVHEPHIMAVCINGGYGNLSHWQAAEFVRDINPDIAFPCHFDMFSDNCCPPHLFRASLHILGIAEKYRLPSYEAPFIYTLTSDVG